MLDRGSLTESLPQLYSSSDKVVEAAWENGEIVLPTTSLA